MNNILKLEHVDKEYGQKESRVSALRDVNIQVEKGEFIAIVGTSGSGKSTLLNLIGGLDNPTNGKIYVNNKELSELNSSELRVAIARALVNKPAILLADEPTGNLDSNTTDEVMDLLKKSNQLYHQTILMVTHNESLAKLCDRVIHIEDGNVMEGDLLC